MDVLPVLGAAVAEYLFNLKKEVDRFFFSRKERREPQGFILLSILKKSNDTSYPLKGEH